MNIQTATSADTGTSAAVDVAPLGSALKLDVTITADETKLDLLAITIETGPTSSGPWRATGHVRVGPTAGPYASRIPAMSQRVLVQADAFLRATWERTGTTDGTFELVIVADDLVIPRRLVQLPNVDESFGIADGDLFVAVAGGTPHLTADRTYTILDAGSESGHEMDFINVSAHSVVLLREDTTPLQTLTSGQRVKLVWCDFGTPTWLPMGAPF